MRNIRSFATALVMLSVAFFVSAQAPSGYYDSAKGKNKAELLKALEGIVGPHTAVSYAQLYDVYQTSDVTSEGYIWDMYATTKYSPGKSDRCGNYSSIGDCYNREHSFPKSWFNDASPMVTDAFHIYPTDGKVNGQRSNYPYGECSGGTYVSSVGSIKALGKLGSCTFAGYSGTVFEPDDEYKGDFARTYFYMAAAYNSRISSWSSAQLAGNSYPCFSDWSIKLLMKWNRQDPVSQKEIDRNNAVYAWQKNRNPFIDNPELAEYIWGNRTEYGWTPGGTLNPMIVLPQNGSTLNMGITGLNIDNVASVTVKASDLSKGLSVSIAGSEYFSTSVSSITASAANAGTTVQVKYRASVTGKHSATLTISGDEVDPVTVALTAEATSGIPANAATDITATSFTANWVDVDFKGNYTLNVKESDRTTSVTGYPVQVTTSDETYTVSGLQPDTDYYYSLSSSDGRTSDTIAVHTLAPEKVLALKLPEGGLSFTALPGEVSETLEATVFTDFITEQITATISDDFEISLDKSSWAQTLTVDPDGESLYVRMKAHKENGEYSGVLSLSTPTFEGDEATVYGKVSETASFIEDFEQTAAEGYVSDDYQGTACLWKRENVGIYGRSADKFNGTHAACTAKSGTRSLLMGEDKLNGAGTLTFYAAPYGTDADAVINVVYSTDGGQTWNPIASNVTVASGDFTLFSYKPQISGSVRIGFEQVSGKRLNIDDVTITDFRSGGVADNAYEQWDAYPSATGHLEFTTGKDCRLEIYSIDATKVVDKEVVAGKTSVELPAGIYIVVSGEKSKKVIVR